MNGCRTIQINNSRLLFGILLSRHRINQMNSLTDNTTKIQNTPIDEAPSKERLTKNMNVLSFDCGLSNLAYCLIEYVNDGEKEFVIRLWENLTLNEITMVPAVESLIRELDSRSWMLLADHVCVESQLPVNSDMRVISHSIQTYFITRTKKIPQVVPRGAKYSIEDKPMRVHFISPQSKFKVCKVDDPTNLKGHSRNKMVAILMAKKILKKENATVCLDYLSKFEKQDDLADCFLQGLWFLRSFRRKQLMNQRILGHVGKVLKININENADPNFHKQNHLYRSEGFTYPEFDICRSSLASDRTVYRRESVDNS